MFICDQEFLDSLQFSSEEERLLTISKLLGGPEITANRIRVLVLADLHLRGGADESFQHRLALARKWFKWNANDTNWDALVVAGDLVAADSLGWGGAKERVGFLDCHAKLAGIHADAGRQIAGSVLGSRALAVPGNHDVVRIGGDKIRRSEMRQMLASKGPHQVSAFVANVQTPLSDRVTLNAGALSAVPRLLLVGGRLGVVAIVGIDSNHLAYRAPGLEDAGYIGGDQLENVKELKDGLKKVFKDRPLFLWAVWHHHLLPVYNTEKANRLVSVAEKEDPSSEQRLSIFDAITIDGRTVVEHCCEWRVSLATHGHMHAPCIQRVSYSPHTDQVLNVLACPSCLAKPDPEHPYVGATHVEIDFERGRAQISVNGYQRHSEGELAHSYAEWHKTFTVPLASASRVPIGEMRLHRRLNAWLTGRDPGNGYFSAFPRDLPRPVPIGKQRAQSAWEESIPGCLAGNGYVPVCMGSLQEVLQNGMLTREQIASLPKKKYKFLLTLTRRTNGKHDILLNNYFPLRNSDYGSWDAPLLPAFKSLHDLVSRWLLDVRRRLDDYRELALRGERVADEVCGLEGILGQLLDLEKAEEELVTLSTRQFIKFSPTEGTPILYEYSLTHWQRLSQVDSVLKSLLGNLDYVRRIGSDQIAETHFRDYHRGLVWIPIDSWQDSEAIKARNSDVMQWVDDSLAMLRGASGVLPPWLELGSGAQIDTGVTRVDRKLFGNGAVGRVITGVRPGESPESLVSGLDHVLTNKDNLQIYRGQEIRTGLLRLAPDCAHGRIGIDVYVCGDDGSEVKIGALRPVQRYVLVQGLRRADLLRRRINEYIKANGVTKEGLEDIAQLGMTVDSGYLSVRVSGVAEIAVLPLIVEQIAAHDQEGQSAEFILCDGNHRLVQYLLIDKCESVGCAIVVGEPRQPYYAWPFSRLDWNIVLQNQLADTPDVYSKYTPRYSDGSTPESIRNAPDSYRQFFRDFNTGFLDIGNQGGRLV